MDDQGNFFVKTTYHVGNVLVIRGEPPEVNPYRGDDLYGPKRHEALRKFMLGVPQPELTFWYAHCSGGAKRCTRDEVNWETSGVKP
jgi:hypothetical protein